MTTRQYFRHLLLHAASVCALMLATPSVQAERADRDKPINIESDRLSVDDKNKQQIFEGRVKLVQGSLVILADKLVVTQDAEGFQQGVATGGEGGLARLRQKREGKNEYVEGEAERIVYDSQSEVAKLFQRAYVKSGRDEVRGQYIEYDGVTENYVVTNGPNASVVNDGSRVRVTIQPANSATSAPARKP